MEAMLTPEEIADFLRIDVEKVLSWITKGCLPAINIDGEWRISNDHFESFLKEKYKKDQLRILRQNLKDSGFWAEQLTRFPELISEIENRDYPKDSMGAFLKKALQENKARQASSKVVRLHPKKKGR